ncbi:conjugal transfer protein TrbE [Desulfovibrio sp. OttesenSCG-928-F07]|nr:conjugal transfer protein TrbE [Desulfovibrio sp. OttesenSCG-928-F07]
MLLLKSFRKNIKGFADLLKYAALIEPDIVLNKDGSMSAMYEFKGKDTESSTPAELNYIALQMNTALKMFGDGWALHVDAPRTVSTYYPDNNFFKSAVAQAIDDERKAFFADAMCYQTKQYMTITYLPEYAVDKIAARASGAKANDEIEKGLKTFKQTLAAFEDTASSAIKLRRLGEYTENGEVYHELLEVLHYLITGIKQQIKLDACPMYLDAILPSQDLLGGAQPKIEDKYIGVVSIDGFPHTSYPAMLRVLNQLPFEYRFHTRFIALSKESAAKEIKMMQKGWNQKVFKPLAQLFNSSKAKPNTDALRMVDDAGNAEDILNSDYVSFGYLTSNIVVLDTSLETLEEATRLIRKAIQGLGFSCRIETINIMDAWLGSHPANTYANIRRPLINTFNLAHLLPLASIWHGDIYNPCDLYPPKSPCLSVVVTDGNTPFYFNTHVSDVGHTLVLGPTGSGKSTLLNFWAAQFLRYPNMQFFAFDKSKSLKILCDAVGGTHFELGTDKQISFQPFAGIDNTSQLAWATGWIEDLINLQGKEQVSAKQRNTLAESLKELSTQPVEFRTMTQLHIILAAKDSFLADSIKNYTLQGTEGFLFDANAESIELSDITVFEIEELMNRGDHILVPALQYLFATIERRLDGRPSVIMLDEARVMITHPIFGAKIREWLNILRKKNCIVVLATQQLNDVAQSAIYDVLAESCPTKVFLPNKEVRNNAAAQEPYIKAGLNEREIEIIGSAVPKREYYIKSTEGNRLINLRLQKTALAFLTHNSKEALAAVEALKTHHPENWQELWLEEASNY